MYMSDMPMGSKSMGTGTPSLFDLQKIYWTIVGCAVAVATVVNVLNRLLARHRYALVMFQWRSTNPDYPRLRDSSHTPAKPKSLFLKTYATITAMARETSYATIHPLTIGKYTIHFPPLGPVLVILANLTIVLVLCFYGLDTTNVWKWEDVGYQTGFIAICQLPLIFLLAGRQNIIGFLADMSYARLNWFHRWAARTLWLTATMHMCFWFRDWARYDYIVTQIREDDMTKRGFAAWCILTFIVLASLGPIRQLSYEVFVLSHLITFVGFIAALWLHAMDEVKFWVWISIGLLVFDRLARYAWGAYVNLSIFHRQSTESTLWRHQAQFEAFPGNVTRVTIQNPGICWMPGQHVFLTCHAVVPLQSHPFTIVSVPEDDRLEFFIRAENGGTRRFFHYASRDRILGTGQTVPVTRGRTVFVEGPYGTLRPLRQFDSVVLLAGGMGATFTIPLLRDIVSAWKEECDGEKVSHRVYRLAATKRIRLVWVIKSRSQLALFEARLQSVLAVVENCRRTHPNFEKELDVSIYITCDEKLEPPTTTPALPSTNQGILARQTTSSDEVKNTKETDHISVHSISADTSTPRPKAIGKGCLPGGGCCCTTQIEDEDEITSCTCTCSGSAPVQSEATPHTTSPTAAEFESSQSPANHPPLTTISGRPHPRTIIRKVLERAEGESAVVVCGPQGLADDVRRSVVYLSDERAVHKGTGAQGIYLHVENFGW